VYVYKLPFSKGIELQQQLLNTIIAAIIEPQQMKKKFSQSAAIQPQ